MVAHPKSMWVLGGWKTMELYGMVNDGNIIHMDDLFGYHIFQRLM